MMKDTLVLLFFFILVKRLWYYYFFYFSETPEKQTQYSPALNGIYGMPNGVTEKYDEKTPLIRPKWSQGRTFVY